MKRIISLVIIMVFTAFLASCSGDKQDKDLGNQNENSTNIETDTDSNELEGTDADVEASGNTVVKPVDTMGAFEEKNIEIDYISTSEKLAKQMVEGDFGETYDMFSPLVKLQTKQNDLVVAWEATVTSLGQYVGVLEQKQKESGDVNTVNIILEYENNGLDIAFTYNKTGEMIGLWFSYAPLEMIPEVNDEFEEISITVGEETPYPIDGILTLPIGLTKPPVAILVPGSGNHDQDETIGPNKPFRDIAHGLARQGIASIRYRESILDYEELKSEAFTIEVDSLNDASKAITYAVNSDRIDMDHIVIIGHSLGGMMASKIAVDHKEISGIISLAGSPRRLEDIVVDQQRFQLSLTDEYDEKQAEALMAYVQDQVDEIKQLKEGDNKNILGYPAYYWYSLNQIDIPKLADSLNIPILITQGSDDWQVTSDYDYAEWLSLFADKDNITFQLYEHLNHLFMKVEGKEEDLTYNIKRTVDQQVIDDIAAWINQL